MGEKLLIKKEKKQYIEDLKKTVVVSKAKHYFVEDSSKDYNTEYGQIKKQDLKKPKAFTNQNKEFFVLEPQFIDYYKRIKRHAQIISLKDIGSIITTTGINKNSTIAESGSGSGGLTAFLAMVCKKVYSFDIEEKSLETTKNTLKNLNIKNVTLKKQDTYKNIPVKNMDVIILDLPEPWNALNNAYKAAKKSGFIVSYSPCITQTIQLIEEANKNENLLHIKTFENIQREWKIDGKAVRPKSQLNHTAFITILRKLD